MKFTALLFYAIRRVRREEMLLRSPRVPLEIFTSLSRGMTLRFLGVLFAFSLFLVKMSFMFILLFVLMHSFMNKEFSEKLLDRTNKT